MEPLAIDVVLSSGDQQTFSRGKSWRLASGGRLEVLDADDLVVAVIAEGRWSAVGYRYTSPVVDKPEPGRPKKLTLVERLTGR